MVLSEVQIQLKTALFQFNKKHGKNDNSKLMVPIFNRFNHRVTLLDQGGGKEEVEA